MSEEGSQRAEEEEQVVEEEPEFDEERFPVKNEVIAQCLSNIRKTAGGQTYAFSTLNMENRNVQDLTDVLGVYKHLRDVNLNHNDIKDVCECSRLDYLVNLQASHNKIAGIDFFAANSMSMQYLQTVDLSHNKIQELRAIPQPKLLKVNCDHNQISACDDFGGHANLVSLSLNKNKLTSVTGLKNFAQLQELSLGQNQLTSVKELEDMPNLRKLNLDTNKFEGLNDMPCLPMLEQLDLSNNKLANAECLSALLQYKKLQVLVMTGCPFVEEMGDRFKAEVLVALGTELKDLRLLGEEEVTDEDITAANEERAERAKQKKEAEEEAARLAAEKAEEEAAAANKPAEEAE